MGTKGIDLLIVDDAALIRERYIALISRMGGVGTVREAADVEEGIASAQEHRPDLVLLDMSMPGGSGIDVLKKIKQLDPPPAVAVLTNYPYAEYEKRCVELGAEYFLDKTADFHKIKDVIAQTCNRVSG